MTNDSIIELQKVDCNCNNCIFMYRDMDTYRKWESWHRDQDLAVFEKRKKKAMDDANTIADNKQREAALRIANKMKFQFEKANLLQYGKCSRFGKSVSFIPNTCQIETQNCFIHRKDLCP